MVKDIVLHVDSSQAGLDRIPMATAVAKRFSARLVGLFAEVDDGFSGEEESRRLQQAYQTATDAFHQAVHGADLTGIWGSMVVGTHHHANQVVIEATRRSDLAIVGQADRQTHHGRAPADLVEQVVVNGGRPVLILPHSGMSSALPPGQRILVAWNGGRESTRAVNDAIPFLQRADDTVVMAMNPPETPMLDGAGLCDHLLCHGVTAQRDTVEVKDIGVAETILSRCTEYSADLLVMGAFGHYGFPHLLRGGVTRDILVQMTIPVLMAH